MFGDHLAKWRFGQISLSVLSFSKKQAPKETPPALRAVLIECSIETRGCSECTVASESGADQPGGRHIGAVISS